MSCSGDPGDPGFRGAGGRGLGFRKRGGTEGRRKGRRGRRERAGGKRRVGDMGSWGVGWGQCPGAAWSLRLTPVGVAW